MQLTEGVVHALEGHAILFTGAGYSRCAENIIGEQIKTARAFALRLSGLAGLPDDTILEDAAQEYTDQFGVDALLRELTSQFTVKRVSDGQLELARIPWKRVYTTNYDNVIEMAYAQVSAAITPVTLSVDIRNIPKDRSICVHLNGFAISATRANVLTEIKLTDASYITSSIASSPWATLFRQDLAAARAVFFVGYSLADLDLRRILAEDDLLKAKSLFIVGAAPDTATLRRVRRFGTVLEFDTEELGNQVRAIAAAYTPAPDSAPLSYCVQRYTATSPVAPMPDKYVFDLIAIGDLRNSYVWAALHGGDPYVIFSRAVDQAINALSAGARLAAIHSGLGNGKTLILECLKAVASDRGYTVEVLTRQGESLLEELEYALRAPKPMIFFVDNYPRWLNALRFLGTRMLDDVFFVVSARTSAHDVLIDRLTEFLPAEDIVEIDVDRLGDVDLRGVVEHLDRYGLWAERSAWGSDRKLAFLRDDCKSQWHAILLKIFESPQIVSRFESVFGEIQRHEPYYETLVGVLILAVLGFPVTVSSLVDLCGASVLENHFRRDAAVTELIDFSLGEVKMRSAVAAEFILHKIANPNVIVSVLIKIASAADAAAAASSQHESIVRSLGTFSNLMTVLPDVDRGRTALRLFEATKELTRNATNPQFWLQYAIACMFADELARAERYFATAYSFASRRRSPYNTNQIDNHYARFLLARALRSIDIASAMTDFRDARAIIFRQIQNERLHYPFRVATHFGRFYETFASRLAPSDKQEIGRAAEFIAYRIRVLPFHRQQQRYVSECLTAMNRLIRETLGTTDPARIAPPTDDINKKPQEQSRVRTDQDSLRTKTAVREAVKCPRCGKDASISLDAKIGSTSTATCASCFCRFNVHRKANGVFPGTPQ